LSLIIVISNAQPFAFNPIRGRALTVGIELVVGLIIVISNTQSFAFNPIRGRALTVGAEDFFDIWWLLDLWRQLICISFGSFVRHLREIIVVRDYFDRTQFRDVSSKLQPLA
jgi:hypothetical protein